VTCVSSSGENYKDKNECAKVIATLFARIAMNHQQALETYQELDDDNTVRVRIPAGCLLLGNYERSTGISLIWHTRLAFYLPTP